MSMNVNTYFDKVQCYNVSHFNRTVSSSNQYWTEFNMRSYIKET